MAARPARHKTDGPAAVGGRRHWERPVHVADEITAESSRVLTTVLFTDIVGSTRRAAEFGDDRWLQVLAEHHAIVREQIRRFRGREVDMAVREQLRHIGLEVRSGVHAGECEESGGKLVGIAVHIGSRLLGLAEPDEVLVSSTVKDLVTGSGIEFDDRGEHTLKGIAGPWRLYTARTGP